MEINNMTIEEIEARMAEIKAEAEDENLSEVRSAELTNEVDALTERKNAIIAEAEARQAEAEEIVENRSVEVIEEHETTIKQEERTMFGIETKEYRDAFLAVCAGNATPEQRGIFADNTVAGDGASLPIGLDKQIWDQIYTNHPILTDIDRQAFGIAIKVSQATPAGTSKKKDSDAVSEMTVTFNDVTLAGNDYLAVVKLSYAEARMSQGAMENYIAKAVVDQIGEAMAKDVFARMITDCPAANKITLGSGNAKYFTAIHDCLAKAVAANNPVVYAPASLYYAILGEVDANGQPIVRDGVVLGATLKKDNAATNITVVDPAEFVLDDIASVSLKVQDSVGEGAYIYGAYARAEGCMRKTNAVAYIG